MTDVAAAPISFFDGIPSEDLERIFGGLERRRYPAGSVIIAEGEISPEIYISRSGLAEVYVSDRRGNEHSVGQIRPGATLGEMSLFTGQPATGTVKATEELEALVMTEADFDRVAAEHPLIFRNLGAILSDRLARTNRLTLREEPGHLAVLEDDGAPPMLGYAIASSLAWHTRGSTLLIVAGDCEDALAALAEPSLEEALSSRLLRSQDGAPSSAQIVCATDRTPEALAARAIDLCSTFDYVLVQTKGMSLPIPADSRRVRLGDPSSAAIGGDSSAYAVRAWSTEGSRAGPDRAGVVHVPELDSSDIEAIRGGTLPLRSEGGRAIGWIARDIAGLKVGVALGAGSLRGFAHFGVLRLLERAGIPIDYLAGTSTGAAAAGLYALGHSPDEAAEIFSECAATLFRPTLPVKGLLSNRSVKKFLRGQSGDLRIEDLELPLAIVAADVNTHREVVFTRGLLWQAVLASISIPGVYPALEIGPYTVVDGGVLDPVPVKIAVEMGAGTVIGVKLVHKSTETDMKAEALEETGRPLNAVTSIIRSIEIMQSRLAPEMTDATTVLVTPNLPELPTGRLRTFAEGKRYIEDGEAAAEAALPRMAAALPWLRR
jgi:NTE family protein